jgi:hypothetical protein
MMQITPALPRFPLTSPSSEAAKEAKRLHDEFTAAYERAEAFEHRHNEAVALVNSLHERRERQAQEDAAADKDESPEFKKLTTELHKAQAVLQEPWDARRAGVREQLHVAANVYHRHLDAHLFELIDEVEAEAVQAHEAISRSAESLRAALTEYDRVRDALLSLLPRGLRSQGGVIPSTQEMWQRWQKAEPHLLDPPVVALVPGWRTYVEADRKVAA